MDSPSNNAVVLNSLLEKLKALVTMNENLKQQEQEFRTHCRVSTSTHKHTHTGILHPVDAAGCLNRKQAESKCYLVVNFSPVCPGGDGPSAAEH